MIEMNSHLQYVGTHEQIPVEESARDFAAFAAILDQEFSNRQGEETEFTDSWAATASETLANNGR